MLSNVEDNNGSGASKNANLGLAFCTADKGVLPVPTTVTARRVKDESEEEESQSPFFRGSRAERTADQVSSGEVLTSMKK